MAVQSTADLAIEIKRPRSRLGLRRPRRIQSPITVTVLIVATVAGSSAIAIGTPLVVPLCLLCPFARTDEFVYLSSAPEATPGSRPGSSLSKRTTTTVTPAANRVPDKYEKGQDGKWRRADTYSLYGSTVCIVRFSHPFFRAFILCWMIARAAHLLIQPSLQPPVVIQSITTSSAISRTDGNR
jgi:hypothetical protein